MTSKFTRSALAVVTALTLVMSACSSGGSNASNENDDATTTTTSPRAAGPAAEVSELSGGKGMLFLAARPGPDLDKAGYVENEYAVAGKATAYALTDGQTKFPEDGQIALKPTTEADYKTRIIVRRPKDPEKFNGTVVVEWNNVSGGLDIAPDWTYAADELVRSGFAWVGVSAQMIGIEGGPVAVSTSASKLGGAGEGIKHQDPARYGSLNHPGDAYAYDIYTQVARAMRANDGQVRPLGDLQAKHVLAMGESQSAIALTTYYDGVQPLTHEFDGFLIHSRSGAALSLGEPGEASDITSAVTDTNPVKFRTDLTAPIICVQTESDVLGILKYLNAQQSDNPHLRLWEVAGTAHVDTYQLGPIAKSFECPEPVNAGPDHFIVANAVAKLNTWVVDGKAPPHAERLKAKPDDSDYVRDANGIAEGGVRTPQVDIPTEVLSGMPSTSPDESAESSPACFLAGSTTPIPPEKLADMYPSRQNYLTAYAEATTDAIDAGFVLRADRSEMLADAQPDRIPS